MLEICHSDAIANDVVIMVLECSLEIHRDELNFNCIICGLHSIVEYRFFFKIVFDLYCENTTASTLCSVVKPHLSCVICGC